MLKALLRRWEEGDQTGFRVGFAPTSFIQGIGNKCQFLVHSSTCYIGRCISNIVMQRESSADRTSNYVWKGALKRKSCNFVPQLF